MIEFGEKVKRAREGKGMTQQTLADQLYVTRQAVSRWECGARYPDLLTAKKLSDSLEVSLDELLSGEERTIEAERAPVLDQRAGVVQTALLALAVLAQLMMAAALFLNVLFGVDQDGSGINYSAALLGGYLGLAGLFLLGLIRSVRGRLTPRWVGGLAGAYYGFLLLQHIAYMVTIALINVDVVQMLCVLVCLFLVSGFFFRSPARSAACVYVPVCLGMLWNCFLYLQSIYASLVWTDGPSEPGVYFAARTTALVGQLAFQLLLVYQARMLERKRKGA